jgi:predicted  nucleic acid-binding Zn-ribbon protein
MFLKISIGLVLVIIIMAFAGRWYYNSTQETLAQLNQNIATLRANQEQLEQAIATSNETIARQQADAVQFSAANDQLRESFNEAERYQDELARKLASHDLTRLTLQRPGLIEPRVNNATLRLFDELENITGKPTPTIVN